MSREFGIGLSLKGLSHSLGLGLEGLVWFRITVAER